MSSQLRSASPTTNSGISAPQVDHVGILVRDLESVTREWERRLNVTVAYTFTEPSLAIRAKFLATESARIELYTIDDPEVLDVELGQASAKIDHVALRIVSFQDDVDLSGCTIRGPGRPHPIEGPIRIADSEHLWVEPTGIDVVLQIIAPTDSPAST
ncbi:VOC family protein [Gordonia sp. HY442]|uniref:VOC family protein n=1 Tax=Gordonia zhenghanii TaxID=2911516 RepID=UPI001F1DF58D|nr:VOC family protein [Gordonia zhenghanii]MCF8607565.1 VOC family protein [Gordonia zhenghanii]